MTDDLMQFLRDRLDEDGSAALGAKGESSGIWGKQDDPAADWIALYDKNGKLTVGQDRHIARHDPARVLAEVEAKRRIMECHESWVAGYGDTICGRCGREHVDGRPGGHFPCQTLRLLALPYAGHPDYQQEWKP